MGRSNLRFDVAGNLYVSDPRLSIGMSVPLAPLFLLSISSPPPPPKQKKVFIFKEETSKSVGAVASYGQSNVSSETHEPPISATSLNYTLPLADGMVIVCSADENRVLVFPPGPPASNDIAAIRVLGQPGFTSDLYGSALDRMSLPYGVIYVQCGQHLEQSDPELRKFHGAGTGPCLP